MSIPFGFYHKIFCLLYKFNFLIHFVFGDKSEISDSRELKKKLNMFFLVLKCKRKNGTRDTQAET